jgi:hypothetical protein
MQTTALRRKMQSSVICDTSPQRRVERASSGYAAYHIRNTGSAWALTFAFSTT